LICLFHPERVERFLALNIGLPWSRPGLRTSLSLWRFSYQWVLATPGLGPAVARRLDRISARAAARLGFGGWTQHEIDAFLSQFREPARARATTQLYREFTLREMPRVIGGRYRRMRLTTPTRMLFGTEDKAISVAFTQGYEPYTDDLQVEYVPGCGHFIADERPELVAQRSLEFFGEGAR
jgi:pimeloyl-ACP methyl ester carboxylesterase